MNIKFLIIIGFLFLVFSCRENTKKQEKPTEPTVNHAVAANDHHPNHKYHALESLSHDELVEINRNLSAQIRNDYRSWSFNEPNRWDELAMKFADELICVSPSANSKKSEIEKAYKAYLTQRAEIFASEVKNKKELMGKASKEFSYNLNLIVGIEGMRIWEQQSRKKAEQFKTLKDSLNAVIAYSDKLNSNSNNKSHD